MFPKTLSTFWHISLQFFPQSCTHVQKSDRDRPTAPPCTGPGHHSAQSPSTRCLLRATRPCQGQTRSPGSPAGPSEGGMSGPTPQPAPGHAGPLTSEDGEQVPGQGFRRRGVAALAGQVPQRQHGLVHQARAVGLQLTCAHGRWTAAA